MPWITSGKLDGPDEDAPVNARREDWRQWLTSDEHGAMLIQFASHHRGKPMPREDAARTVAKVLAGLNAV